MIQEFLFGMDIPWFIQCLVCVIIAVGVYFLLNFILKIEKIHDYIGKYPSLSLLLAAIVSFCQLEIANHNIFFKTMSVVNIGINILTLFAFMELLYMMLNRAWVSIIVWEIVTAVLSVVNYYTLYFRGTPVTAQDVPAIKTAINASADLKFTLLLVVSFLLLVMVCCLLYACLLRRYEVEGKGMWYFRVIRAVTSIFFLWFIYCCSFSPKPANTSAWIWRD